MKVADLEPFVIPIDATGRNCTEYFDPCEPNPCANRGTCQPAYGGHYYTCNCPANYGGYTCEGNIELGPLA